MAWKGNFDYRRELTVSNDTGSSQTDVALRLRLSADNFTFANAETDGSDVTITATETGAAIASWREEYDSTGETAIIWFKAGSLATGNNTFYLYYGDAEAADPNDPTNTFLYWNELADATDLSDLGSAEGSGTWSAVTDGDSPTGFAINVSTSTDVSRYKSLTLPANYGVEVYTSGENASLGSWGGAVLNRADNNNWYRPGHNHPTSGGNMVQVRRNSGGSKTNFAHVGTTGLFPGTGVYVKEVCAWHPQFNLNGTGTLTITVAGNQQGVFYDTTSGKVYISTDNNLARYTTAGVEEEDVSNNPGGTSWGDIHVLSGTLYAVRFAAGDAWVYSFDPADLAAGATLEANLTADFANGGNGLTHDGTNWLIAETDTNTASEILLHVYNSSWVEQTTVILPGPSSTGGDRFGVQGLAFDPDGTLWMVHHDGIVLGCRWDPVTMTLDIGSVLITGQSDSQSMSWNADDSIWYFNNRTGGNLLERTIAQDATAKTASAHWRGDHSMAVARTNVASPFTQDEFGIGAFRNMRFAQLIIYDWLHPIPKITVGSEENAPTSGFAPYPSMAGGAQTMAGGMQ